MTEYENEKLTIIRIAVSTALLLLMFVLDKICCVSSVVLVCVGAVNLLVVGYDIFFDAISSVLDFKMLDECFLMSLASLCAFAIGESLEAVLVLLLFQIGELCERRANKKSKKSIEGLLQLKSAFVNVVCKGKIVVKKPENVQIGDVFVVRCGEKIALDGKIVEGVCSVNMCALTGESLPVFKEKGDLILSGTINLGETIKVRCTKKYEDSTIGKILNLVENASSKKTKTEKFISKFSKIYTPVIVVLSVVLFAVLKIACLDWYDALKIALTFLVVSCPCALVISVPLAFFSGIGVASKLGILFKGGNFIEKLNNTNTFIFDKTGTITKGKLQVVQVQPQDKKEEILSVACVCEKFSLHPIAKCILERFKLTDADDDWKRKEFAGEGIVATLKDTTFVCGNEKLLARFGIETPDVNNVGTQVFVAKNGEYLGCIVIADAVKQDSAKTVLNLKKMGVKCVMLTGDCKSVAKSVANEVYINEFESELLPQNKVEILENYMKDATVAFVGDGINDAPVIMRADIGIAMGGIGSDSAVEASDIVIMDDKLSGVIVAKKIARKTMRIAKQNIVFALLVKFAVLTLSPFGFVPLSVAVLADVGVTVLAVLNSLRILKEREYVKNI